MCGLCQPILKIKTFIDSRKLTWNSENGGLEDMEDDVLLQRGLFSGSMLVSGDYHNMYTICMNIYLAKL